MDHLQATGPGISMMNLQEFFQDCLQQALQHQRVHVDPQTEQYVVAVLTRFARAEELHDGDEGRRKARPLAARLTEALDAPHAESQRARLRQLGDVSLFMAGFLAGSFSRKLVDVDYCIAMGGGAYGSLASSWRGSVRGAVFTLLFTELAGNFQRLVDVLNEIADMAKPTTDMDVLRVYEIWLKTGSCRARHLLESRGIMPLPVSVKIQA